MESVTRPISPLPAFDNQPKNAGSVSLRNPLPPEVLREPAGFARKTERRASRFRLAAGFALAIGVGAVAALLFFLIAPASRQSDTESAASEITGSMKVAMPPPDQDDIAKPALAQFKGLLAATPASQPAPQEQPEQLLQQFKQWRQKDNSSETSH